MESCRAGRRPGSRRRPAAGAGRARRSSWAASWDRAGRAPTATPAAPGAGLPGVSLAVPPGQSLALLASRPGPRPACSTRSRGSAGRGPAWSLVDGVAVNRLGRAELDRYRARRGLVSPRFPLLPSLSVVETCWPRRPSAGAAAVGRPGDPAARAGRRRPAHRSRGPAVGRGAVAGMIARALVSSPRLVLAEDPSRPRLGRRRPGPRRADGRARHVRVHAVLTANRPATAVRCQRRIFVAGGSGGRRRDNRR